MKFGKAQKKCLKGARIRRKGWAWLECHLEVHHSHEPHFILVDSCGDYTMFTPQGHDIFAGDWEVLP